MALSLKIHYSTKSIWLFILMLLSVDLWYLAPVSTLMVQFGIFFYVFWLLVGHVIFMPRRKVFHIIVTPKSLPVRLIFAGVILSFLPAFIYYGQNPLTSFITSRQMWSLLTLPVLFAIKPDVKEIKTAISFFVLTYFAVTFIDSILDLPILDRTVLMPDNTRKYINEGEYLHLLDGHWWIVILLAFNLSELVKKFRMSSILVSFFILALLYIAQNRTFLLAAFLLFFLTFIRIEGKNKSNTIIFRVVSVLLFILALAVSARELSGLLTETVDNLGDDGYNRALAYTYFLTQAPDTLIKVLFGDGFISNSVSSVMADLMAEGIYNADVGLVGMWNYFGLLPVLAILIYVVRPLFDPHSETLVKYISLITIVSFATVGCFTHASKLLWLCVFFYLAATYVRNTDTQL